MALTVKGKAVVEGIPGKFDVIAYPVGQSIKGTASHEEEIIKDEHSKPCSWLARNQEINLDAQFKLLGDTKAHAVGGAVVLAPLAKLTFTADANEPTTFDGDWQNVSGQELDFTNSSVAGMGLKLRKYTDSDTNTAAHTTPL